MIKKVFSILLVALMAGSMAAQEAVHERPQRTPEEEAGKQTSRLVRELGIRDSVRIDTIYRMHLKYARYRQKGLSRAENMERMQAIYHELQVLLTPDEFEQEVAQRQVACAGMLHHAVAVLVVVLVDVVFPEVEDRVSAEQIRFMQCQAKVYRRHVSLPVTAS